MISSTDVAYGVIPSAPTPTKAATDQYTYSFVGWSPTVKVTTANTVYTAVYDAVPVPAPPIPNKYIAYFGVGQNHEKESGMDGEFRIRAIVNDEKTYDLFREKPNKEKAT